MKKTFGSVLSKVAMASILAISASTSFAIGEPMTLSEAKALTMMASTASEIEQNLSSERDIRSKAMREAAQSYGARSGLIYRIKVIAVTLDSVADSLDASINFTPLLLTDKQLGEVADNRERMIIAPVITKMGKTFNQADPALIRQRDTVLRIDRNAQFASSAPNWRSYLLRDMGETKPALPHASLLPRTDGERANWSSWVEEGWAMGVQQADAIFDIDRARLSRDFEGMVLYYELVDQKVLSLPFVATRNDGVTGDGNQININDVTLKISVMPAFDLNSSNWIPTVAK